MLLPFLDYFSLEKSLNPYMHAMKPLILNNTSPDGMNHSIQQVKQLLVLFVANAEIKENWFDDQQEQQRGEKGEG